MANTSAPRGFYNPRLRTGGAPNTRSYRVTAGEVPIAPGTVVTMTAAGTVSIATTAQLTLSGPYLGVSMSYLSTTDTSANKAGRIDVVDDLSNTLWDVQLSHAATTQALIGESLAGSSNNVVQTTLTQSRGVLKAAGAVTTGACVVVDFVQDDTNDTDAANPRATVYFRTDPQAAI